MLNKIAEIINENGIEAKVDRINKNNEMLNGIIVGNGDVRAVFYEKDMDLNDDEYDIAMNIINYYERDGLANKCSIDMTKLKDYELVKDKLYVSLRKKGDGNDSSKKDYLDLEAVVRCKITDEAELLVTAQLCDEWGVDYDDVYSAALANENIKYMCSSMMDVLMGLDPCFVSELNDFLEDTMYVLTTEDTKYGSGALLHTEILDVLANKFDSDLYIIPASVHELIIVPISLGATVDEMNQMVKEVNVSEVRPEEQLSDHVYIYVKGSGKVTF